MGERAEISADLMGYLKINRGNILKSMLTCLFDCASVFLAGILALLLRSCLTEDFLAFFGGFKALFSELALFSIVFIVLNILLKNYYVLNSFRTIDAVKGVVASVLCFVLSRFFVSIGAVSIFATPEAMVLLCIISYIGMLFIRNSKRLLSAIKFQLYVRSGNAAFKKTLIYGAGEAGNYFIERVCQKKGNVFRPVVFIDDDRKLHHHKISGLSVMGGMDKLEEAIQKYKISVVVVAINNPKSDVLKEIVVKAKKYGCETFNVGVFYDYKKSEEHVDFKPIKFEEFLHRESVSLNREVINEYIKDKIVAVTGGVGSIGSEICRQVLAAGCKKLLIIDINENGLFHLDNALAKTYPRALYEMLLGSVRDKGRLDDIFKKYKPDIVLHAAAHKHVPMTEMSPKEAIKNNVFGTINVCEACHENSISKLLLISTDKAVNPTNIMGASKRIAEMVIQMFDSFSETSFVAVRFGNVLGSNGSVIPLFESQIKAGGPVTVTDREITRYFMTIPEAVSLVLEAGSIAKGGEIFVLDMGKPVKIYDLACDLIRYFGKEPGKDIEIKITGLRPGEKLYEELSMANEETEKTDSDKINVCKPIPHDAKKFKKDMERLKDAAYGTDIYKMLSIVKEIVPTFNHNNMA